MPRTESHMDEVIAVVRAGDVLVMRRDEPISQLIRWMDDTDPTRPVDVSHSMLVMSAGANPTGFSVWPLPDTADGVVSDVVIAPLRQLLRPYDRVIVLRHRELIDLDERAANARVAAALARARAFHGQGCSGAIAFDDKQLYAKALAFFGNLLDGAEARLVEHVLRRIDDEITSSGAARVICPELIIRAFNEGADPLRITTSPVLPDPLAVRAAAPPQPVDWVDAAWGSFKRQLQVGACSIAVDLLVRSDLDPPPHGRADPADMLEYSTPGDLQRSADLIVIGGWQAWTGKVADVWGLPGGRSAVRHERLAGPGAPPLDVAPDPG